MTSLLGLTLGLHLVFLEVACASDAASLVAFRTESARLGSTGPLHLASTDMEKYFDRLLLPTLRQLATMAKLDDSMFAVLDLYASLRKHIFLDGCPSRFVLFGDAFIENKVVRP